jgi:hypothetical protein
VRVLVSDGSSLSARQVITALGRRGAAVDVVDPSRYPLARFSRFVRDVHEVPRFGNDPWGWLDATLELLRREHYDVLFAVHEQTAVLARAAGRVRELGVGLAVPPFEALRRVQDKAAAVDALAGAGLAQPPTELVATEQAAAKLADRLPLYLKARIGTASTSVFHVTSRPELASAVARLGEQHAFDHGGVLVQQPLEGRLVMVQAVFESGELRAHHANLRVREGASGSSSHKRSVTLPRLEADLESLGHTLGWHGALSLDAIVADGRCHYIDVNPRLVEPGNAQRAGVDLVGCVLDIALGRTVERAGRGRDGVSTHQLLLALLGAAQRGGGRRAVARELAGALFRRGAYAGSAEELTPVRHDPQSAIPLGAMAAAVLARPDAHKALAGGAISSYALTPEAWRAICEREPASSNREPTVAARCSG